MSSFGKCFRYALPLLFAASMPCEADSAIDGVPISGIYDEPIRLSDGSYEGPPFVAEGVARPRVELAKGMELLADLDGDDVNELVVVLTESSGGTGVLHYLAAFASGEGGWIHRGTIGFGDRVQIRSLQAESGEIRLELVTAGPEEPACCPSMKKRNRYRLGAQGLEVIASEELGALGLADLEGVDWRLTRLALGEPAAEGVVITARFADGKIAGSAGCNRYFAPIEAASPYEVKVGLVGLTSMICPDPQMEVERRFLEALEGMTRFGFVGGRLLLGYRTGASSDEALLFEPADKAE